MAATAAARADIAAPRGAAPSRGASPPRGRLRQRLAELTLLQRLLVMEALIFLLAFFGVLSMVEWYASGLATRIDAERSLLTRAFAGEVDHTLRHGFEELNATTVLLGEGQGVTLSLDRLVRKGLFSGGALLLDAEGRVAGSDSRRAALRGLRLPAETVPSAASVTGGAAWGIRLEDGTTYVALVAPADASAAGHRLAGLIAADSGIIADAFARAVSIADTAHAELVDGQGKSMFSTEPGHSLQTSDHPSFYVRRIAESLPPGTYRIDHEDGVERERHVMAFVQLESLPWVFALGGTERDTYAPVGTLWRAFYSLTAVAGVIAVAVTLAGAPRLTQPVRELSEAAREVAGGSLETPIAVGSGGEIGELARSVETMRRSLYDWGVMLDQRVMDRTEEIERRNLELAASVEVARIAGSTFEVEQMLRLTTDYIERAFEADGVVAYLPARGRRAAVRVSSARIRSEADPGTPERCEACLAGGGGGVKFLPPGDDRLPPCLDAAEVLVETFATHAPASDDSGQSGSLCLLFGKERMGHRPTIATLQLLASALSFGVRNSDLYQDIRQREAHARLLVGKVLAAQEEERRRVARELHDDAGQALASLMFGLDALDQPGAGRGAARAEQLAGLRTVAKDAIDSLRRTIFALRPPALDDLGLEAAIMRYADLHAHPVGVAVSVSGSVDAHRLGSDGEVALFRVVQEALNNIVRHSGATAAQISLRQYPDGAIEVHVRDNGRGFDLDAARRADAVGIYGMAERAEMLGGHLTVTSTPGEGTVVSAVFPAAAAPLAG